MRIQITVALIAFVLIELAHGAQGVVASLMQFWPADPGHGPAPQAAGSVEKNELSLGR